VHADEVVRVHYRVNEAIQQDREENITVVVEVCVQPIKEKDCQVMVHMQEGKLAPFLPQNNKDCIPKVPDLGNVEQPQQVCDWGVFGVKNIAG